MFYIYLNLLHFILFVQYTLMLWVIMFWGYIVCLTSYVLADGITITYFIYFILFIQLYTDVMGKYVLRLCGVFNLLCCGRWNSQFIYIMLM